MESAVVQSILNKVLTKPELFNLPQNFFFGSNRHSYVVKAWVITSSQQTKSIRWIYCSFHFSHRYIPFVVLSTHEILCFRPRQSTGKQVVPAVKVSKRLLHWFAKFLRLHWFYLYLIYSGSEVELAGQGSWASRILFYIQKRYFRATFVDGVNHLDICFWCLILGL